MSGSPLEVSFCPDNMLIGVLYRLEVLALYNTLHENNICHIDIHTRHVMKAKCKCHYGRYMLIDFEAAKADCTYLDKKRENLRVNKMLMLSPVCPLLFCFLFSFNRCYG